MHKLLQSQPMLKLQDLQRLFIMDTDACVNTKGAILLQECDNRLYPVAFYSSKYNPAERNYGAGDKELLAIVKARSK